MSFKKFSLMKKLNKEYLVLAIVFFISVAVRLKINFSTEYIPGCNGAFYLLLVRSIIETGSLIYKEFPLIFYMQAWIALVPIKLGLLNINTAIDLTSRLFDSIVPSLSIIPAYLIVKEILPEKKKTVLLISSLAVLHFTFFSLVSDFQKNALSILWLFWLLYFLLKCNKEINAKNIIGTIAFFVLTGLTHFGCFGVAILMVMVNVIIVYLKNVSISKIIVALLAAIVVFALSFSFMYWVSKWRAQSFLDIIFKLFSEPIIFMILRKEPVLSPYDLFHMLLVNIISVVSLVLLIKNNKFYENRNKSFVITTAVVSLVLSSPFISYDFSQRLLFISYITIIPLLAFIYYKSNIILRRVISIAITILIAISVLLSVMRPVYSNMNAGLYASLEKMKKYVPNEKRTLLVARHGMEFWSSWVLRNEWSREIALEPGYFNWYTKVFFIRQKKNIPPFGPSGIFGVPFKEPSLPEDFKLIYSDENFGLYLIQKTPKDFSIFKERE